jgi:tetratricopeptide (TPR) repeat protein
MNLKRIIRDAFIMISFCGTFYVSTFMWGKVDEKPPSDTNFSKARVAADDFVSSRRWEMAADRYKRMTEEDPYNGYAWYRLGTSYNNVRFESQSEIRVENQSLSPSAQQIEHLKELIAKYDQLALEAHETARKFLRYRSKSLFQLAIIHSDLLDYEASLECLREFVEGGYWTGHGLDSVSRLGAGGRAMMEQEVLVNSRTRLHAFEEFWELVDKERQQKKRRNNRRRTK